LIHALGRVQFSSKQIAVAPPRKRGKNGTTLRRVFSYPTHSEIARSASARVKPTAALKAGFCDKSVVMLNAVVIDSKPIAEMPDVTRVRMQKRLELTHVTTPHPSKTPAMTGPHPAST